MDWLYANCSTTAQRGALDWKGKFREAVAPLFSDLYRRVADGTEARIAELAAMGNSEMWRAGAKVRDLRPENWKEEA